MCNLGAKLNLGVTESAWETCCCETEVHLLWNCSTAVDPLKIEITFFESEDFFFFLSLEFYSNAFGGSGSDTPGIFLS